MKADVDTGWPLLAEDMFLSQYVKEIYMWVLAWLWANERVTHDVLSYCMPASGLLNACTMHRTPRKGPMDASLVNSPPVSQPRTY